MKSSLRDTAGNSEGQDGKKKSSRRGGSRRSAGTKVSWGIGARYSLIVQEGLEEKKDVDRVSLGQTMLEKLTWEDPQRRNEKIVRLRKTKKTNSQATTRGGLRGNQKSDCTLNTP